jgi:threonine/homoserine/homoserine lactone efflux protein
MLAGFLGSATWSRMDLVAKIILNVVSVAAFIWLALKITRRPNQPSPNFKT